MFCDPEARATLAGVTTLDELWLAVLATEFGRAVLHDLGCTVAQFEDTRQPLELDQAALFPWFTRMLAHRSRPFCAEYVLGGMLTNSESDLVGYLRQHNRSARELESQWRSALERNLQRHTYDHGAAYLKAHLRGRDRPSQAEVLEQACLASPLLAVWLEEQQIPYQKFASDFSEFSWSHAPVTARQLAQACGRQPEITRWAARTGITRSQLISALTGIPPEQLPDSSGPAPWLALASEEALREGQLAVDIRHLLQALLCSPHGVVARILSDCQVERVRLLDQLRGPLSGSALEVEQMSFAPPLLDLYQRAPTSSGERRPPTLVLFEETLNFAPSDWPLAELRAAAQRRRLGNLPLERKRLDVQGVSLGMALQAVQNLLQEAGRQGELVDGQVQVAFANLSVSFKDGLVTSVAGDRLGLDQKVVLQAGDDLNSAELCLGHTFSKVLSPKGHVLALVLREQVHGVILTEAAPYDDDAL